MPRKDLSSFTVALSPGGIEQSQPIPRPSDLRELENWVNFRGRWAVRPGIVQKVALQDGEGTPADVTQVLSGLDHAGYLWTVSLGSVTTKAWLHKINKSTWAIESGYPKLLWSSITSAIVPVMVGMGGPKSGSTDESEQRVYICDYNQTNINSNTQYIVSETDTLVDWTIPFIGTTDRKVYFSTMLEYQYHLWGAGFFYTTATPSVIVRDELLRFSQAGLIPADEDIGGTTEEWWVNDWRGLGLRAEKITCLAKAGGGLIVFKKHKSYLIQGFDRYSWGKELLSDSVGAVGPYAADTDPDGRCFFWSVIGPGVCDGRRVDMTMAESIRKFIQGVKANTRTSVQVSPDDQLVYFAVEREDGAPSWWALWDIQRERWADGNGLIGATTRVQINKLVRMTDDTLPGPAGDPSALVVTTYSQSEMDLAWTNGDVGLGTVTEIWGSEDNVADDCAATSVKVDEVPAGVATYRRSGLTSRRYHCFKVRHRRNGQYSNFSNIEEDKQTKLAAPTDLVLTPLTNGIEVAFTKNETGGTILIEARNITDAGSWFTVVDQAFAGTGAKTYDHTSGIECYDEYEYRLTQKEASWPTSDILGPDEKSAIACEEPELDSCDHGWPVLEDYCPGEYDITTYIGYTASGNLSGATVKFYYSLHSSPGSPNWQFLVERPAASNGQEWFLLDYKNGGLTRYLQGKVEIYAPGAENPSDTETSVEESFSVAAC